jgi:hypothetical protein
MSREGERAFPIESSESPRWSSTPSVSEIAGILARCLTQEAIHPHQFSYCSPTEAPVVGSSPVWGGWRKGRETQKNHLEN